MPLGHQKFISSFISFLSAATAIIGQRCNYRLECICTKARACHPAVCMSLYILWAHICCSIVKKFSNILVVMVPTVLSWEIALAWPFWIVWYIFQILLCAKNQNVHQLRRAYLFWCTTCSTFFLIKYLPCLCLCTYIQCLTYLHCKMLLLSCSSLVSQRVYLCVSWIRCIFIFFVFVFVLFFYFSAWSLFFTLLWRFMPAPSSYSSAIISQANF